MATLATMQPTSEFGELYQYSNLLAAAAGYVGGHVAHPQQELGAAYDAAMQSLVFDPLGMTSTTLRFRPRAARQSRRAARAGRRRQDRAGQHGSQLRRYPEPPRWRCVEQRQRHAALRADGTRQGPAARRHALHRPRRRCWRVASSRWPGAATPATAWASSSTAARAPCWCNHGGSAFGFISDMLWLPEHDVGAVILTNDDAGGVYVRSLFRRRLLEVLFDGRPEAVDEHGGASQAHEGGHCGRTQVPGRAGRSGAGGQTGCALPQRRAGRHRCSAKGSGDVVRLRRLEERGGFAAQRRWHGLVRDDFPERGRLTSSLSPQRKASGRWYCAMRSTSTFFPRRDKPNKGIALGSKFACAVSNGSARFVPSVGLSTGFTDTERGLVLNIAQILRTWARVSERNQ